MESGADLPLEQARRAYARHAWADALACFQQSDRQAPLATGDLECLAWSAGMLDRDDDLLAAFRRLVDACTAAGRDDRAAYWAFFHGFRQFVRGEHGQATAWMQKARQLAGRVGHECAVAGYLHLPTIHRLILAGDFATAVRTAAEAVEIGERCGEADLVAFARCLLGRAIMRQGGVDAGVAQLDEAMLAAVAGELSPVITGLVYCSVIASCRQVYAFDRSREWTQALSHWCDSQPQLVQFNGVCLVHRAEILELNGSWQEAVAEARRAAGSLAGAFAAETAAGANYQEAEIHRLRGEFDAAEKSYRAASRLGLDPQPGIALLRLAQGQGDKAAAILRRALAAIAEPLARVRLLPAFVEILLAVDAVEEARQACTELEAVADRFATPILAATAALARGQVEIAAGAAPAALGHLRTAHAIWQGIGAPYIEARIRVLIGRACRLLGDDDSARLEFESAGAAFEQLGAAPDVALVSSLLVSDRERAPLRLTRREVEVLGLIATGKTNKRIANQLGLSEKTVDRHVSNIFDKLGVSTRAAATACAFQNRLL